MEAKDFSAVTPEIEALAAKSRENNRIDISLYDKYEVKRGLRDLNGKGSINRTDRDFGSQGIGGG